jgi:hydrogenase maturation protease
MSSALVIGYGNTLRGDDAAGVRAAETIALRAPETECLCVHQLTPELAEKISHTDTVVFIDAQAGIEEVTFRPLAKTPVSGLQTHVVSPEILLLLCETVYGHVPHHAYALGIPAAHFDFSEKLSPETEKAVQTAVEKALDCIGGSDASACGVTAGGNR